MHGGRASPELPLVQLPQEPHIRVPAPHPYATCTQIKCLTDTASVWSSSVKSASLPLCSSGRIIGFLVSALPPPCFYLAQAPLASSGFSWPGFTTGVTCLLWLHSSQAGQRGSKCVQRRVLGGKVLPAQVPNQTAHVPHPTQYTDPGMQAGCPCPLQTHTTLSIPSFCSLCLVLAGRR